MPYTYAGFWGPETFLSKSGRVLSGLQVTVYLRGTTTLATLYSGRTKAATASNPFTTDSNGNGYFYADPGQYDVLANGSTLPVTVFLDPAEATGGGGGGVTDHGDLTGLGDDDHSQYYNATRHTKAVHDALALSHDSLSGVSADDHHAQSHVLTGGDHTASGLTSGHVLRATAATTFGFGALQSGDLPSTADMNARLKVYNAGSVVGTRRGLNITAGTGLTMLMTDDAVSDKVDIILASTGGGASATYYVVTDYGALGDGTTDDTAAIQAAINAASADGGGVVFFPAGRYKVASAALTLPTKVTLLGAGPGVSVIVQAYWGDHLIKCEGSGATTLKTTLSADVTVGANSLSLTSVTGISHDEYYILSNQVAQSTENPTRYQGEMVQVRATPSDNPFGSLGTPGAGTINLRGFARDSYASASSGRIEGPLVFNTGNQIRDLSIENSDPANAAHLPGYSFIRFVVCSNFLIDNVKLTGCDAAGIVIQNCRDGAVTRVQMEDFSDSNNYTGGSPAFYGYGISVELASENIAIGECVGNRLRHFITTDGIDGRRGVPRGLTVANCVAKNCSDFAYDTHAPTADSVFYSCHAHNCVGGGFEIRGANNQLIGCSVSYAPKGIQIKPDAHGATIKGCIIRHMQGSPAWTNTGSGTGTGQGIVLVGSGSNAADHVTIEGCRIDACDDIGIVVAGNNSRLHIIGNEIYNTGRGGNGAGRSEGLYFTSAVSTLVRAMIADNWFGNTPSASTTEPGASGTTGAPTSATMNYAVSWHASATGFANCKLVSNKGANVTSGFINTLPTGWTSLGNVLLDDSTSSVRGSEVFQWTGGLATFVKAGSISDADFAANPPDGTTGVNTTNNRFHIRTGGSWKGIYIDILRPNSTGTSNISGAGVTIDASTGSTLQYILTGNVTSSSITNPTNGQRLQLHLIQDGTGSRTFAWPANVKFSGGAAPTLTTTANRRDVIEFMYDGTNWIETSILQNIG